MKWNPLLKGFNSTLVQLKDFFDELECIGENSFNSTLVQLKGITLQKKKRSQSSFNSTLVQLKDNYYDDQLPF